MFKKRTSKELDALLESLRMNSANNYKDAAKEDYELFWKRLEELHESGELSDKGYARYEAQGMMWKDKMKNYHHQNNVTGF